MKITVPGIFQDSLPSQYLAVRMTDGLAIAVLIFAFIGLCTWLWCCWMWAVEMLKDTKLGHRIKVHWHCLTHFHKNFKGEDHRVCEAESYVYSSVVSEAQAKVWNCYCTCHYNRGKYL